MRDQNRWPRPWFFSLLILPLGIVVVGFNFTALPALLAQAGVPVDKIATISSIINLPGVIGFLFAPVVDIKFRRRTWLAIGSCGTAFFACLYFPLIGASHLMLMTALILAGGMVTFLVGAACGGLIVALRRNIEPYDGRQLATSAPVLVHRFRQASTGLIHEKLAVSFLPLISKGIEVTRTADTRFEKGKPLVTYFEISEPL